MKKFAPVVVLVLFGVLLLARFMPPKVSVWITPLDTLILASSLFFYNDKSKVFINRALPIGLAILFSLREIVLVFLAFSLVIPVPANAIAVGLFIITIPLVWSILLLSRRWTHRLMVVIISLATVYSIGIAVFLHYCRVALQN